MRLEKSKSIVAPQWRTPTWVVLGLGFGGLLICIIIAATGTLWTLQSVRNSEAASRKRFLDRIELLDQIRAQIYLSGTYVRDLLLSPDVDTARAQAEHLKSLRRETRAALDAYAAKMEAGDHAPFGALRSEIDAYWKVLEGTIGWSQAERDTRRFSFFYQELVPRRTAMLQIADRIGAVNERGLERSEVEAAASASRLRVYLGWTFAATLAGGIILALLTIRSTLGLERELSQRRSDLEELSNKLLRAQENERRALARELHDEVGQSLSAILMETESAETSDIREEVNERLGSIRRLAENTVKQVRDLALLLRPSMLDDLGLGPALNWYARETSKRTGLGIMVTADHSVEALPDEHRTCIYRMVQEAVNNSVRHAQARKVEITARQNGDAVEVSVRDDGAGFDTRYLRGLGLLGMEERVRRLGGRLQITSEPGRGTAVHASLPVAQVGNRN